MSKLSEKPLSTKTQLIEAAANVFSEFGIKGATTKEIARRAGVHETTLFRHFESKELLLRAVLEHMSQEMTQSLKLSHQWTDDLYKDLLAYGYIFRDALVSNIALIRALISEGSEFQQGFQQIIQSSQLSFKEHIISYIEQAIFVGQVRAGLDAQKIARVYTGMIMSSVLRGDLIDNRTIDDASPVVVPVSAVSLEESLDILIHGISVRP